MQSSFVSLFGFATKCFCAKSVSSVRERVLEAAFSLLGALVIASDPGNDFVLIASAQLLEAEGSWRQSCV